MAFNHIFKAHFGCDSSWDLLFLIWKVWRSTGQRFHRIPFHLNFSVLLMTRLRLWVLPSASICITVLVEHLSPRICPGRLLRAGSYCPSRPRNKGSRLDLDKQAFPSCRLCPWGLRGHLWRPVHESPTYPGFSPGWRPHVTPLEPGEVPSGFSHHETQAWCSSGYSQTPGSALQRLSCHHSGGFVHQLALHGSSCRFSSGLAFLLRGWFRVQSSHRERHRWADDISLYDEGLPCDLIFTGQVAGFTSARQPLGTVNWLWAELWVEFPRWLSVSSSCG